MRTQWWLIGGIIGLLVSSLWAGLNFVNVCGGFWFPLERLIVSITSEINVCTVLQLLNAGGLEILDLVNVGSFFGGIFVLKYFAFVVIIANTLTYIGLGIVVGLLIKMWRLYA